MNKIVVGAGLGLSLAVAIACAFAQGTNGEPTARFALPPPQVMSWNKPVKCKAIASASLSEEARDMEDFSHPKLSVYVKKGTDSMRLWLDGDNLIVQVGAQKPDTYHVSGHHNGFLVAVHYGGVVPTADSISLDEKTGFAVWSFNEPMLVPVSEFPYAESIYMQCVNQAKSE